MVAKYDMTLEEAYKKIEELELKLKFEKDMREQYITLEAFMNHANSDQTVCIYTEAYEGFVYKFTGVEFGPFENFYDNEYFQRHKSNHIYDMWAENKDEISIVISGK